MPGSGPRDIGYAGPIPPDQARAAALTICDMLIEKHGNNIETTEMAGDLIEAILGVDNMIELLGMEIEINGG